MVWTLLFRVFCCLCRNRQTLNYAQDYYRSYWDDSDEESDEDEYTGQQQQQQQRAHMLNMSNLKRNAIDATTDVIVADELLRRHGDDSGLLMYYDRCSAEMHRALEKLPLEAHGAQVKMPHKSLCDSTRYIRDIV